MSPVVHTQAIQKFTWPFPHKQGTSPPDTQKQLFPQVAVFDGKSTPQTFHLSPNKASHHNDCTIWDFEIETMQGCGSTHINNRFPRLTQSNLQTQIPLWSFHISEYSYFQNHNNMLTHISKTSRIYYRLNCHGKLSKSLGCFITSLLSNLVIAISTTYFLNNTTQRKKTYIQS
jgi:hypothetical protein